MAFGHVRKVARGATHPTTAVIVIDVEDAHYVGDKFMFQDNLYLMCAAPPSGDAQFMLVNMADGAYWCRGIMTYEEICKEIEYNGFVKVASCEIKVHVSADTAGE